MFGQTSLPTDNPSLALQVDTDQVTDVASESRTRSVWTGFGFATLMLLAVSACALLLPTSHADAESSRLVPAVAGFAPIGSSFRSAVQTGASTASRASAPLATGGDSRRAVLSKVFGGAALLAAPQLAGAVKATTGLSSQFTGDYEDPNHPGCLRTIKVVGAKTGADGRKSRNPSAIIEGWDGPANPNLVRLNGEVENLQFALQNADAAAEPEVMGKLEKAKAARDKVASQKKACVGQPERADVWKLTSKIAEDDSTTLIDFSSVGGPQNLLGRAETVDGTMSIVFPDGNRWTKMPKGTPERRPKDLKTLTSGE
jgi:hypothetical protein